MLVKDYIAHIEKNYSLDHNIIKCIWEEGDVESVIQEKFSNRLDLIDKIPEIIKLLEKRHDANEGINWLVIEGTIGLFIQQEQQKQ